MINQLISDGGLTPDRVTLESINKNNGYMVSVKGSETITSLKELDTEKEIREYQKKAKANQYIGLWLNENKVYIDISEHYTDKAKAIKAGKENEQLAIYDIENDKSIFI